MDANANVDAGGKPIALREHCSGELIMSLIYEKPKPEDHWSCIAHPSAEDMLKLVVIEEKQF